MIFTLNKEYVFWEVVELARLQMCEVLKVPTSAIEAKLDLGIGVISPEFLVDADQCKGVTPEGIRAVLESVYAQCKEELEVRLDGVVKTRDMVIQEMKRAEANPRGAI